MRLVDALRILRQRPTKGTPFRAFLACGFTPGHLQTFLAAHLQVHFPNRRVEVATGVYGDIAGNLKLGIEFEGDAAVVVLEWSDLDPRLGIRSLGGWEPRHLEDIVRNVPIQITRIMEQLQNSLFRYPVVVCLPTLPLPPAAFTPTWQASSFEREVQEAVARLGTWITRQPNLRLVSDTHLLSGLPLFDRFAVQSEVLTGFPYSVPFASQLAKALAQLIINRMPMKGIITDLDDTLWHGILGEVGIDGVSWDMEHRSHMHGLYQQVLLALAKGGTLIAVASKNDPVVVKNILDSGRLILSNENIFPVEAHWGAKSESVTRILDIWNVSSESVVFIDDSPMELAEVKSKHPDLECISFPKDDYKAVYELLARLRDLFGKTSLTAEDSIRLKSIRQTASFREESASSHSNEDFLRESDANLEFAFRKKPTEPRVLELVNKTNQFNLNGKRHQEVAWRTFLEHPDTFLLVASYQDKYGPLGRIAVIAGRRLGELVSIDVWVMSCRAFSRRVEYSCLAYLFDKCNADEIVLDFEPTPQNGPFRDFLSQYCKPNSSREYRIARTSFIEKCPARYHAIREISHE